MNEPGRGPGTKTGIRSRMPSVGLLSQAQASDHLLVAGRGPRGSVLEQLVSAG